LNAVKPGIPHHSVFLQSFSTTNNPFNNPKPSEMSTPNSSPPQTKKYNSPQTPSNHIQHQPILRHISKASAMATPSSSPSQTKTKEYKTKFHLIKAYALYCGTPSLTFNQEYRDMKAFVKSLYQSQTPAERLREIDRRMWEKYGKSIGPCDFWDRETDCGKSKTSRSRGQRQSRRRSLICHLLGCLLLLRLVTFPPLLLQMVTRNFASMSELLLMVMVVESQTWIVGKRDWDE
jgi:hypothetical protein